MHKEVETNIHNAWLTKKILIENYYYKLGSVVASEKGKKDEKDY